MPSRSPDRLSEPIVGFRYWFYLPGYIGDVLLGAAGCYIWKSPEQHAKHAWGGGHVSPLERCTCGIHAFTRWRERDTLSWFDHWPSAEWNHRRGLVGGAIIAWGRIAEHGDQQGSEGFRAEHARILALSHPRLAERYRVPYVPEPSLELYAAEFGQRFDEVHDGL